MPYAGLRETQTVASGVTLTRSYVAGTVISGKNYDTLVLDITYTEDAAETNNTMEFKIEFSSDNTTFYQEVAESIAGAVATDVLLTHTVASAGAGTATRFEYPIDLANTYIRVSFKESGVATTFGTVSCTAVLTQRRA